MKNTTLETERVYHAHWINAAGMADEKYSSMYYGGGYYQCSHCRRVSFGAQDDERCRHCGAHMDEVSE